VAFEPPEVDVYRIRALESQQKLILGFLQLLVVIVALADDAQRWAASNAAPTECDTSIATKICNQCSAIAVQSASGDYQAREREGLQVAASPRLRPVFIPLGTCS
jgi:hypothetical protein